MKICATSTDLKQQLDLLYSHYNRRQFIHPDPLEFLFNYTSPTDIEVVGLIASCLAYGKVKIILKSVSWILEKMGPNPADFLIQASKTKIQTCLKGFSHRFTKDFHISALLLGMKGVLTDYGSVENCFLKGLRPDDPTILSGLSYLIDELERSSGTSLGFLLPHPKRGSACKRPNLFLRWMIRNDDVDPGIWDSNLCNRLIVPLDTHMHRISLELGLTTRKNADLKTALEVTESFKKINPSDPVKYDFALTRLGIRRQ